MTQYERQCVRNPIVHRAIAVHENTKVKCQSWLGGLLNHYYHAACCQILSYSNFNELKIRPHVTALAMRHLAYVIRNDLSLSKLLINLLLALVLSRNIVFEQDAVVTLQKINLDHVNISAL